MGSGCPGRLGPAGLPPGSRLSGCLAAFLSSLSTESPAASAAGCPTCLCSAHLTQAGLEMSLSDQPPLPLVPRLPSLPLMACNLHSTQGFLPPSPSQRRRCPGAIPQARSLPTAARGRPDAAVAPLPVQGHAGLSVRGGHSPRCLTPFPPPLYRPHPLGLQLAGEKSGHMGLTDLSGRLPLPTPHWTQGLGFLSSHRRRELSLGP